MIKHLYDIFAEKWYRGGTIYFISDTHFGDLDCYQKRFPNLFKLPFKLILDLADVYRKNNINILEAFSNIVTSIAVKNRAYSAEEESQIVKLLDEAQIRNVNKACHKNDTLIVLGDISDKDNVQYGLDCIKKLKAGYKVLILGNHDKGASNYKRIIEHEAITMQVSGSDDKPITIKKEGKIIEDNHLFDEVYEGTLQIGPKLILSHEPIDSRYCLNIHGHRHCSCSQVYIEEVTDSSKKEDVEYNLIKYNVCGEFTGYRPVMLSSIINEGLLAKLDDIHEAIVSKKRSYK